MPRKKDLSLRLIAIRLCEADLDVARGVAGRRHMPYQHVVRGWVSDGAQAAGGAARMKARARMPAGGG